VEINGGCRGRGPWGKSANRRAKKQLEEPEQSASQQNETEIDLGIAERALVLRYAHPTREHQARSVERLEQFNAARKIEALSPDAETAASLIQ